MILSTGAVVRLSFLVLVGVVIQLAVVSQFTFWGANADLTPLIVVSAALLAGPVTGSIVGFSIGLLVDMALVQTLGVSSLLLIGIGYLVGRYRELRDTSHALVPPLAGALATLVWSASFSVTQFLLGVESSVSPLVIRDILLGALINGLLMPLVYPAVRWLLRPCLTESLRPRRRPSTTGLRIPAA